MDPNDHELLALKRVVRQLEAAERRRDELPPSSEDRAATERTMEILRSRMARHRHHEDPPPPE